MISQWCHLLSSPWKYINKKMDHHRDSVQRFNLLGCAGLKIVLWFYCVALRDTSDSMMVSNDCSMVPQPTVLNRQNSVGTGVSTIQPVLQHVAHAISNIPAYHHLILQSQCCISAGRFRLSSRDKYRTAAEHYLPLESCLHIYKAHTMRKQSRAEIAWAHRLFPNGHATANFWLNSSVLLSVWGLTSLFCHSPGVGWGSPKWYSIKYHSHSLRRCGQYI